ncbi:hypothetical protein HPP92_022928 [Vanilla planifolia]|uniref:BHLH domain-containing protein n=1 Tax=Vanilla planifolia TaxID=51239 RepID=A0A835PT69_VANPL|nr:hypothetical protein HPP92_022928 [Vanilla planifolia]
MEKGAFFGSQMGINWQMPSSDAAATLPELSTGYLNLSWDQSIEQTVQFESALSSLVSSPSSHPQPAATGDSVVIRELIGRLGSICNSDEISPPSSRYQSAANSCYSTPLNSPPKLNLTNSPFSADPGFVYRAAKYSSFVGGGRSYGSGQFLLPEAGNLSRVSSSQSLKASGQKMSISNDGDESLASGNAKKRKAPPKAKGKEASLSSSVTTATNPSKAIGEDSSAKRSKSSDEGTGKDSVKPEAEKGGDASSKEKEEATIPPEPPKDYIHVRARRGQATDSHSLAERVRREKISERMKFLQDLVPGCNKVTGKAVMLDEIINYVQSLQRQVEFLSMKLATVNPQFDYTMDSFHHNKDMHQTSGPVSQPVYPLETTSNTFSFINTPQGAPLMANGGLDLQRQEHPLSHSNMGRNLGMELPSLDGFAGSASPVGGFWVDDLHNVVQMGFNTQNQEHLLLHSNFSRP